MNLLHASALAVVAAALSGAQAHAAGASQVASPAPTPTEARFADLDRDDDNKLSLGEYTAGARAEFDAMDTDHNRNLTVGEMDVADPQADGEMSSAQKIALHDDNQDSVLSIDEYDASVEDRFRAIDVNDDDSIDITELKSGIPIRVPAP